MNLGNTKLEIQFEKAIRLLCKHTPIDEGRKKPLLMHALRVGMSLYNDDYPDDVVIGGLLHDILEWTDSPEELIKREFGDKIYEIVEANTKNRGIIDPAERRREYIDRCISVGEDALIVKAADTLDSYRFYIAVSNTNEINRCVDIAKAILEKLPDDFKDKIFSELTMVNLTVAPVHDNL